MHPYRPRPIAFHGIRGHGGWRLKQYSIIYGGPALDGAGFEPGMEMALRALPSPARTQERPGVGFTIAHQGRNADYVVLGWWDRENELPVRVCVREAGGEWRPARGSESICVWDLQVLWFEREAYVATVLNPACADAADTYLARRLSVEAPARAEAGALIDSVNSAT